MTEAIREADAWRFENLCGTDTAPGENSRLIYQGVASVPSADTQTEFEDCVVTALEEDIPELFLDYIKQKMGKAGTKKKEALISFYNTFVTNYNSMIEQDENKTSDETLYLGGQRKYQLNRSFLELTRDGAIDCIINAEENRQAGILREGT